LTTASAGCRHTVAEASAIKASLPPTLPFYGGDISSAYHSNQVHPAMGLNAMEDRLMSRYVASLRMKARETPNVGIFPKIEETYMQPLERFQDFNNWREYFESISFATPKR
jgi:hypothetical protein